MNKLSLVGMQLPEKYKENFDVSSDKALHLACTKTRNNRNETTGTTGTKPPELPERPEQESEMTGTTETKI